MSKILPDAQHGATTDAPNPDYPSQWPNGWPDVWSPGGSAAAKTWRAKRVAAWEEQNHPQPGIRNPHRQR